jgi:hypothetical protein
MNLTNGQVQHAAWPDNGKQAVNVVEDVLEHLVLSGGGRLQQQTHKPYMADEHSTAEQSKHAVHRTRDVQETGSLS